MIYFFYGDEEFNISNEIKKLKSNLDKDFIEMSFKQFNNPKFPDLIAAVRTQPMMFGKMLIVINCLTYLSGKSSDENGFDDKQIKQALRNSKYKMICINDDESSVDFSGESRIIEEELSKKFPRRSKFERSWYAEKNINCSCSIL